MIYYEPIPICEHDALIGSDFNEKFAKEMNDYYAPYQNKSRTVNIGKETWEYAVSDSIENAKWCGAGNNVVDVVTPRLDIDVKGISCNNLQSITSEASILQNLQSSQDNFYVQLKKGDYEGLNEMFIEPFIRKVSKTNNLHVLCAIRDKEDGQVWYCLLKVIQRHNPNLIDEMVLRGTRNVDIPLIDPKYGRTYLQLGKRRLELRLNMAEMRRYCVNSHSITLGNSLEEFM